MLDTTNSASERLATREIQRALKQPQVSLLICMRNEANYIERCLASLLAQDYPSESLEICVLDGQSSDGSWGIATRMLDGRANCHLLSNPGITAARGWNMGIERSTGEVIGIVSAHCELAPDYVSQAVETLQRTGADLIGGPMRAFSSGKVGLAIALATSTPFGVGGARFHYTDHEEEVDTVYMGVCWRSIYDRIGCFDANMGCNEDDELSYRLLEHGGRIACNPAIRSYYHNRATFASLWKQYFKYGYWKPVVMQKHPAQMRFRHFVPATFVATLLLSIMAAVFFPGGLTVLLFVAGSYLIANLAASIWTAHRDGWRNLSLLPLVFSTLHLSYGIGFLKGMLDFVLLSRNRTKK
jgi:succinoglycan biosynthesis protein ExoA